MKIIFALVLGSSMVATPYAEAFAKPIFCPLLLRILESPDLGAFMKQISWIPAYRNPQKLSTLILEVLEKRKPFEVIFFLHRLNRIDFNEELEADKTADLAIAWRAIIRYSSMHYPLEFEETIRVLERKFSDYYFKQMGRAPTMADAVDFYTMSEEIPLISKSYFEQLPWFRKLRDADLTEFRE